MSDDFQFLKFLNPDFVPTPEIINEFEGAIQVKEIKRKQLLQRKGDTHSKAYFVRKGLLKSYVLDEKGKEHIFMFAPENWIVTDINSVTNYGQTELFIQAIEDSEVEVIQGDAFMKLTHKLQSNSQLEVQK